MFLEWLFWLVATCPEGTKPLIHPLSQSPQKCTIGVSICGQGYQCQNADSTAIVGFCCTTPDTRPTRTFSSRRAGTLYSMEPPEVTLPPMAVVARPEEALLIEQWRPEIRLVDIQKEMDRINELTHKKNVLTRPLSSNQRRAPQQRTSNGPKCPSPMSPLMYMDTSLPLSCDLNSDTPCPAPAECTYAFNDPEFRTLCCLQNDFEDIDELFGVYTKYPAFEKRLTSTTSLRMPTTTPITTTIRQTEATSTLPLSRPSAFVASSTGKHHFNSSFH
uniref:Clip domain-containing protein n=1 Tax=Panagrellus redivivus TaxID=6233 RepID=A0A7E4VGT5_PANRE